MLLPLTQVHSFEVGSNSHRSLRGPLAPSGSIRPPPKSQRLPELSVQETLESLPPGIFAVEGAPSVPKTLEVAPDRTLLPPTQAQPLTAAGGTGGVPLVLPVPPELLPLLLQPMLSATRAVRDSAANRRRRCESLLGELAAVIDRSVGLDLARRFLELDRL